MLQGRNAGTKMERGEGKNNLCQLSVVILLHPGGGGGKQNNCS